MRLLVHILKDLIYGYFLIWLNFVMMMEVIMKLIYIYNHTTDLKCPCYQLCMKNNK